LQIAFFDAGDLRSKTPGPELETSTPASGTSTSGSHNGTPLLFRRRFAVRECTSDAWNAGADASDRNAGVQDAGGGIRNTGDGIRNAGDGIRNAGDGIRNAGDGIRNIGDAIRNTGVRGLEGVAGRQFASMQVDHAPTCTPKRSASDFRPQSDVRAVALVHQVGPRSAAATVRGRAGLRVRTAAGPVPPAVLRQRLLVLSLPLRARLDGRPSA
jgi:hypothetical protein